MNIKDILAVFRNLAPEESQSSWDNCGVQIAGAAARANKVAVCLEPTPQMVERCLDWGAEVVLTHHPLYMKPKGLGEESMFLDVVRHVVGAGAWLYAAHTSLDVQPDGPAFWLGERLELHNTSFLEPIPGVTPLEASFYSEQAIAPETGDVWANADGVHSVSQSRTGEIRIVCDEDKWPNVADGVEFALGCKPQFFLRPMTAPSREAGFGQVGDLPQPMAWPEFAALLTALVGRDVITVCGPEVETVSRVAYCGGSGSSLIGKAAKAGADVFVTGDMKYHPAVETPICVADVGHFSIEEEMMRLAALGLEETLDGVDVKFFAGEEPMRFLVSM